jgi:hypothetical protein
MSVSGSLVPITSINPDLGSSSNYWRNAYIEDISTRNISVSGNIIPFINVSGTLGTSTNLWSNAYITNISASTIGVSYLTPNFSPTIIPEITGMIETVNKYIVGQYRYYLFSQVALYSFTPQTTRTVSILIVGGGGGGGVSLGGGGGGGGVIFLPSVTLSGGVNYRVVVGAGGPSQTNGSFSSFYDTLPGSDGIGARAAGGGAGGGPYNTSTSNGSAGGSGGGASGNETNGTLYVGGAGLVGSTLGTYSGTIFGNRGGNLTAIRGGSPVRGAGGGGAGAAALDTDPNKLNTSLGSEGSGGDGIPNTMYRGIEYYWGGGGGGSAYTQQGGGYGGRGGGGGGSINTNNGSGIGLGGGSALNVGENGGVGLSVTGGAGGANTGGGGGSGSFNSGLGGSGGSGIVIIREEIIQNQNINTSTLGSNTTPWNSANINNISASNISVSGTVTISGNIIFNESGGNIRNINQLSADVNNNKITTTSRLYQEISGGINWDFVNGYYGLAKDTYPGLNPSSSGFKAVNNWTIRASTIVNNEWSSVCWSPQLSLFVAVSWYANNGNQIMTSPNGITWTLQLQPETNFWNTICWSPELMLFVAVASSGSNRVMISSNGTNWTAASAAQANTWISVCWSSELRLFVAVSQDGANRVMTSNNGITWTSGPEVEANMWRSVCWSPELRLFVAVAESGANRVMTSNNGITWIATRAIQDNQWQSVCWSKELGIFVAVSRNEIACIMYSLNGIVWTSVTINNKNNNLWKSVCWSAQLELFVAVALNGYIMYSSNGINWTITTSTLTNSINRTTTLTNLLSITGNLAYGLAINCDLAQDALIAVIGDAATGTAGNIHIQDVSGTTISQNLITLTGASQSGSQRLGQNITITNDAQFIVGSTNLNGKLHLWKKNSGTTLGYNYFSFFTMADQTSATNIKVKLTKNDVLDVPYEMLLAVGIREGATGNIGRGRVYSINKTSGLFSLVQDFSGAIADNGFGLNIGISPNGVTLVIQASSYTTPTAFCNIYTYNYTTNNYTLTQTITGQVASTGPNPRWDDFPGSAIAFNSSSSNTMALASYVSSFYVSSFGVGTQVGYVDIYNRISNKWILFQRIDGTENSQYFGWSVGFDATGSSLIIGCTGVYVSQRDMIVYRKFTDSSYVQVSTFASPNIDNATSVGLSADGTRYIVGSGSRDLAAGFFFCGNVITQGIGLNSICWSPELGIFAAVAISSATANNRVITSSLKGRPPTSYNMFDNTFNSIDESGNWTFQNIDVASNLNPMPLIETTRIAALGTYSSLLSDATYLYYIYSNVGSWSFIPRQSDIFDILIVGGGGGGGSSIGGGGGGGGVIYLSGVKLSSGITYPVIVGSGGASNTNGNPSLFNEAFAAGGGAGGGPYASVNSNGYAGGSGGGACANDSASLLFTGGASIGNRLGPNLGTIYGNRGGSISVSRNVSLMPVRSAGGGGAGAAALNTNPNTLMTSLNGEGSGGVGISNDMYLGNLYFWGGGGGGAAHIDQNGGYGGLGGGGGGASWPGGGIGFGGGSALNVGGNGGVSTSNGVGATGGAGGANTGGGGGGGSWFNGLGGNGGSGIVIIRCSRAAYSNNTSIGSTTKPWNNAVINNLTVNKLTIGGTNSVDVINSLLNRISILENKILNSVYKIEYLRWYSMSSSSSFADRSYSYAFVPYYAILSFTKEGNTKIRIKSSFGYNIGGWHTDSISARISIYLGNIYVLSGPELYQDWESTNAGSGTRSGIISEVSAFMDTPLLIATSGTFTVRLEINKANIDDYVDIFAGHHEVTHLYA